MATQYTRTYSFTDQRNTSADRRVDWTRFIVGGDTTHSIGQIVGITFTHWHSSTGTPTRTLRGRLVFADGSTLVSTGDSHRFSGSSLLFTNGFSGDQLPTAAQFAQIVAIETINESSAIDQTGYSSSAKLYWRATKDQPMVVAITFIETPPTRYAPKIEEFIVGRGTADSLTPVEDGEMILTTLKLSIGDASALGEYTSVIVKYNADAPVSDLDSPNSMEASMLTADLLAGITYDKIFMAFPHGDVSEWENRWSAGNAWHFTVIFRVGDEEAIASDSVGNVLAPLVICRGSGIQHVSIGGLPKRPHTENCTEIHNLLYLHGGIAQIGSGGESILPSLGLQSGQTELVTVGSSESHDFVVTFPQAYSATPVGFAAIVAQPTADPDDNYHFGRCAAAVSNVTATGMTVTIYNYGSGDMTFGACWLAIGTLA